MAFTKFGIRYVVRNFSTVLLTHPFIVKNSKSLVTIRFINTNNNDRCHKKQPFITDRNLIYLGLGFVCLSGTYVLKDAKKSILPVVNAAIPIDPSDIGDETRKKFNFIADVVEKTAASVVYISIVDKRRTDFFTGKPVTVSNGSGFIVTEDGLIVTNAHVVESRRYADVEVKLHDGTCYPAIVESIDLKSDLATLRINAKKKLQAMKLGSSNALRPGEWVLAIGSPLTLANTVTCGVVSTVHRTAPELGLRGSSMDYIQTDAAITFGNSGGPLVNLAGEAIGINSMKVTAGISFAIPIDYAKEFLIKTPGFGSSSGVDKSKSPQLPKKYMGITMLSLNSDIIRELQMHNRKIPNDVRFGVLVWKVAIGSPAHQGGLQPGDIITHINDVPIENAHSVHQLLENTSIATLRMIVVRNGKHLLLSVTPEDV